MPGERGKRESIVGRYGLVKTMTNRKGGIRQSRGGSIRGLQRLNVRLPDLPGNYHFGAGTDVNQAVSELLESNNLKVSPGASEVKPAYAATVSLSGNALAGGGTGVVECAVGAWIYRDAVGDRSGALGTGCESEGASSDSTYASRGADECEWDAWACWEVGGR